MFKVFGETSPPHPYEKNQQIEKYGRIIFDEYSKYCFGETLFYLRNNFKTKYWEISWAIKIGFLFYFKCQ